MAIWQLRMQLVPREGVLRVHGSIPEIIQSEFEDVVGLEPGTGLDDTVYWRGFEVGEMRDEAAKLLPVMRSWSDDIFMFGSKEGNKIEVWPDSVNVRVDCRDLDPDFLRNICKILVKKKLIFLDLKTLRLIEPEFFKIVKYARESRAYRFVKNPRKTLEEGQ